MRHLLAALIFITLTLLSSFAQSQSCPGGVCVASEDLKAFVQLAKEAQCRHTTAPTVKADPLVVVVDKEGRIYGSGDDPHPFTLTLQWCTSEITAKGQVALVAAQRVEPTSGFRFRAKAAVGYLPLLASSKGDGYAGIDAGVLVEPLFLSWANFDIYVGVRSFGAGLGFDLTRTVGVYVGYATTWGVWQSNPHVALSFALW